MQKFHDFIYGLQATIETNQRPLAANINKPLHSAPSRPQRMRLQLQKYGLKFIFKEGTKLYVADTLSRTYIDVNCDPEADSDQIDISIMHS